MQIGRGLLTYYNPIKGMNGTLCLQKRAKTHASARSVCCSKKILKWSDIGLLVATNLVGRLATEDVQKNTGNNEYEANAKNNGIKTSILKCLSIETDS